MTNARIHADHPMLAYTQLKSSGFYLSILNLCISILLTEKKIKMLTLNIIFPNLVISKLTI